MPAVSFGILAKVLPEVGSVQRLIGGSMKLREAGRKWIHRLSGNGCEVLLRFPSVILPFPFYL